MNKTLIFFILLLTFFTNILQSYFFSSSVNPYIYPDLNLILIIFIAISKNVPLGIIFAALNGFILDVMSGYMIGINTLPRLTLFIFIKNSSTKFNFQNNPPKILAFFAGTVFVWTFIWLILKLRAIEQFNITMDVITHQATINTLLAILIIFILERINAKI